MWLWLGDPDVWHVALVTWPSLGVDQAAAILTPDDDHYVELFGIDGSGGDDPDKQGEISVSVVEKDVGTGDLRTCWIDTDETGSRFRLWRGVVLESTRETFSDSVV